MKADQLAAPWLRFEVSDSQYAIPLDSVAEVAVTTSLRMIPLIQLDVGGILNVRGEPLPGVNGGLLLEGQPSNFHPHMLVLEQGRIRLGLVRLGRRLLRCRRGGRSHLPWS